MLIKAVPVQALQGKDRSFLIPSSAVLAREGVVTSDCRAAVVRGAWSMEPTETSQPAPRRPSLQDAIRKVQIGAAMDIQKVGTEHIAERRMQRRSRKVEPYGSMRALDDASTLNSLADAAKVAEMEEQLHNKPCYIIHPEAGLMSMWDSVTALALVFTAMVTPFEVGFLPSATSPLEALFVINRLLDGDAAG